MPNSHSVEIHSLEAYDARGYGSLAFAAVTATLDAYAPTPSEVGVELVPDPVMRRLNRDFRGVDATTDVLSFSMGEGEIVAVPEELLAYLGDVAICIDRALEQAHEFGHSPAREVAYLAVHGALHLLGFDHMRDEDRLRMREAEELIMARIGQPDPHAGG